MKLFLLFAITCASARSNDKVHIRHKVKNTFHRIQRPFFRWNVTETMFTLFCLEPTHPNDLEESIQLFSIKRRYSSDSHDLFCVPLDMYNTIP